MPTKPTSYEVRARDARLHFAAKVFADPATSPVDREGARRELMTSAADCDRLNLSERRVLLRLLDVLEARPDALIGTHSMLESLATMFHTTALELLTTPTVEGELTSLYRFRRCMVCGDECAKCWGKPELGTKTEPKSASTKSDADLPARAVDDLPPPPPKSELPIEIDAQPSDSRFASHSYADNGGESDDTIKARHSSMFAKHGATFRRRGEP